MDGSANEVPDILLVYPEGNYIRASDDRPFLQIGESKYGKFMLELAVEARHRAHQGHEDRPRFDDEHRLGRTSRWGRPTTSPSSAPTAGSRIQEFRVTEDSPLLAKLRDVWERHMMLAVAELPPITAGDFEAVVSTD